jgi:hypothetical protein
VITWSEDKYIEMLIDRHECALAKAREEIEMLRFRIDYGMGNEIKRLLRQQQSLMQSLGERDDEIERLQKELARR